MGYNIADLFEYAVDAVLRSPAGKPDYPWAQRVAVGAASKPTTNTFG